MSRQSPPVVFIHGFKGAHLDHSESGRRHWLTGSQALGWFNPGVALPMVWEGDCQDRDKLVPVEPLRKVLHVPFYGPFINWCLQRFETFYSFFYDWRRDNIETVALFVQYLRDISARHGDQPLRVIAHSNGGLITYAAMSLHPELFHSIVFAATPFRGGIGVLDDLHLGSKSGLNRHIASPEVMFSFVTSFAFFPLAHEPSQVYSNKTKLLQLDWYDIATWEEYRFSLFGRGQTVGDLERGHLKSVLQRSKMFRENFLIPVADYPEIAVIASGKTPTLAAIQQDSEAALGWNFNRCQREPGDGRVRLSSCSVPEGVPFKLYESSYLHSEILSDFAALGAAVDDLGNGD
jgi:pimeloyl-ACP methyl ester carboxylesterase